MISTIRKSYYLTVTEGGASRVELNILKLVFATTHVRGHHYPWQSPGNMLQESFSGTVLFNRGCRHQKFIRAVPKLNLIN